MVFEKWSFDVHVQCPLIIYWTYLENFNWIGSDVLGSQACSIQIKYKYWFPSIFQTTYVLCVFIGTTLIPFLRHRTGHIDIFDVAVVIHLFCFPVFIFRGYHSHFSPVGRWTKTSFQTCITNYSWLLTLKLLSISVSMHCWSCVIGESVYLYGDFHCHVCNWSIKMNRRIVIFIWTSIVWLMFVGQFYIITTQKEHIEKEKETYI